MQNPAKKRRQSCQFCKMGIKKMTPKTKKILSCMACIVFVFLAVEGFHSLQDYEEPVVKAPAKAPPVPAWLQYLVPPPKSWDATATLYPIFNQLSWMAYRKEYYLELARAGDPEAMILLVFREFDYNDATYTTEPAPPETADYWLQEACRITGEPGWVYLALAYLRKFKGGGDGATNAGIFASLRKAADTGYPPAVIAYAELALSWDLHYEEKSDDIDPKAEARHVVKLLQEYDDKYDDTHARMLLLQFILPNKNIVVSDEETQTRLKQSATEGHGQAIEALGRYYLKGIAGFPKDIDEGMKWHFISGNSYLHKKSGRGKYTWAEDFPPEQVQKAKDAATAWKAAHPDFHYIPETYGNYPPLWTQAEIRKGKENLQVIYARMRKPLMKEAGLIKDKKNKE